MPISDERRKSPRSTPRVSFFCIMQAKGVACSIDTSAQDNLYVFVDVKNCSDCGVLVHLPFQLGAGTIVNLALPDDDTGAWAARSARVAWTSKDTSNNYCTGIEYLGEDPPDSLRLEWENDPRKPFPSDLSFLMQAYLLQTIPRTELCIMLNALHRTTARAGERLISQGEPGDCLYLIQKGTCVVSFEKEGKTHRIAKLRQGDVVGEMAVLTGEPRTANVDAETDMVLWKLAGSQFDALSESHPDLRLFLTEIMSNRFDSSVFVGDRTIGKYLLSKKIGRGGWGIVYRGLHRLLKMPVAIKMMKHDMAMEQVFLANFRQEAETIARMRHPNIVSVYDIEEVYKTVFIIMEYLEGVSLRDLLNRVGSLPVERCADILIQICEGLACAHSFNVVHRDIKPGNIFLLENDQVKLLDFGLACAPGTADLDIAGTVYYAPPEQIEGRPVDFKADLYSLGVMAYEMIVGKRPYQPESNLAEIMDMHCTMDLPDPSEFIPDLPGDFREFILTCAQRNPDQRYDNVLQARNALAALAPRMFRHLTVRKTSERGVTSLTLVHHPEQEQALKVLLEEFGGKAAKLGVSLLMNELRHV